MKYKQNAAPNQDNFRIVSFRIWKETADKLESIKRKTGIPYYRLLDTAITDFHSKVMNETKESK